MNEDRGRDINSFWFGTRQRYYNLGLVVAGILAFISYIIACEVFVSPNDVEVLTKPRDSNDAQYEFTIFTLVFQGLGYLFMMACANVCYLLGPSLDSSANPENRAEFRRTLYALGCAFSFALPFTIPVLVVLTHLRTSAL